jgi:hypothetical protein
MMREKYIARLPKRPMALTPEFHGLIRDRTMPFLRSGTHLSLEHLLEEAYLQGLRDATQVGEATNAP